MTEVDKTPPTQSGNWLSVAWNFVRKIYGRCRVVWMKGFTRLPEPLQRFLSRHRWKVTITLGILILLSYGYYAITKEPEPEIITAEVTLGELTQVVEAVGEITSERNLKLQFPISGVVAEVLVKEGDKIELGQRIASLRANDLKANMQSALASLQAYQAELAELKEGTRPEDIAIAEAELANKRAQLVAAESELKASEEKLKILEKEAEIALAGEIGETSSVASRQLTVARTALSIFDDVFADSDVMDAFQRGNPGKDRLMKKERDRAGEIVDSVFKDGFNFESYDKALTTLQRVRQGLSVATRTMEDLFSSLVTLPPTSSFSRTERETRKDDVADEKASLQTALTSTDTAIKDLQDAAANFNTKIATENSTITSANGDILNLQSSIRTEEAKLALSRAGARPTEIQASAARVRQAGAEYERSKADFEDTILYAPTTGAITKVNIKEGELLSTAFQQEPAITMLGESPYRVEMYVSEVDIPKVQLTQTGAVELDAFQGTLFPLIVGEIDPAASDVDGVPKYRVKLDFLEIDPGFKIGMTGDVDIVTGKRDDVLMVPARAILENEFGDTYIRILGRGDAIEERRVEIGLEGENDVEIIKGVEEGEIVVVLLKNGK